MKTVQEGIFPQQANALCILKVLQEYSDEEHILSAAALNSRLKVHFGLDLDRRTIYSALDLLENLGYEVIRSSKGCFLADRVFSDVEIHLMTDAINSFPFITNVQTIELLQKLHSLQSVYERKRLNHFAILRTDNKTNHKQLWYNLSALDEAIEDDCKVTFMYLKYDINKNLVPRRKERYKTSPIGTVCIDGLYYLLSILDGYNEPSLYRIDKMKDIQKTSEPMFESDSLDIRQTIEQSAYAHVERPVSAVIITEERCISYIVDRFGTDFLAFNRDDGKIEVRLKASYKGVKLWALQNPTVAEVVEPADLRDDIMLTLKENVYTAFP